jgi:hypothetical protein
MSLLWQSRGHHVLLLSIIHCALRTARCPTSFTTAEADERRPFSGSRPFVFDTEVPRKRHFLWKFTSVLLLAKTRVNELLRVLALGNGRSETLNVFQLLPSFLPSVPLFPSFLYCNFFLLVSLILFNYRFSSFNSHPSCGCQVDSSLSGGSMFISESGDRLSKAPGVRGTCHHFESGKVICLKLAHLLPHPFQFVTLIMPLFATTYWQC